MAYFPVIDNVQAYMMTKELKEVADYTANTFENLYLLSRNSSGGYVLFKKELKIPRMIKDSFYTIEIVSNATNHALGIRAYVSDKRQINADSWLIRGLKVAGLRTVNSSYSELVFACCECRGGEVFVWFSLASV